ncbi:MAG: hypothetical protein AVDCRST_MAG85-958, partial [uncultured Solirubrobacteraceae bacterium]
VAVVRTRDRARLRPARQLREVGDDEDARRHHPDDRDPARQQGRLQRLARGARAQGRRLDLRGQRPRDEAQDLLRRRGQLRDRHASGRHRPQPQLRRQLGRSRRGHPRPRRHVPRRRAVAGAGGPERPRARLEPPGGHAHHEPHLRQPPAAPAGARLHGPAGRRADVPRARPGDGGAQQVREPPVLQPVRHVRHDRGLDVLRDGRLRVHVRDRAGRVPPAVQQGRHRRVPRPRRGGGRRLGRQPRGVLRDPPGDGRPGAALAPDRHRSGGLEAQAHEDDPERDRTGHRPERPALAAAQVHGHADERADGAEGRHVHLEREPVDASVGAGHVRAPAERAAAAPEHPAVEPARLPAAEPELDLVRDHLVHRQQHRLRQRPHDGPRRVGQRRRRLGRPGVQERRHGRLVRGVRRQRRGRDRRGSGGGHLRGARHQLGRVGRLGRLEELRHVRAADARQPAERSRRRGVHDHLRHEEQAGQGRPREDGRHRQPLRL